MQFSLNIRLGNEAMDCPADVAAVLHHIAEGMEDNETSYEALPPHAESIKDANGNTVGVWSVATQL